METWTATWFPWSQNAESMSWLVPRDLENLETLGFQETRRLKYILTNPHDWLVKRVFVYIIEKRKVIMLMVVEFTRHGQKLN